MTLRAWLLGSVTVLGVLVALATLFVVHTLFFKPVTLGLFYNRTLLVQIWDQPELLTILRILEPYGINGHNARWNDASDAATLQQLAKVRSELAVLRSYDRSSQSAEELVSTDVLAWFL